MNPHADFRLKKRISSILLPMLLVGVSSIGAIAAVAADDEAASLIGGPMVGHTTAESVRIWARSTKPAELVVAVATKADLSDAVKSRPVRLEAENDLAGVAEVTGLRPATTYHYQVRIDGKDALEAPLPTFRTFPAEGKPAKVRVLFGGGIRFQADPEQKLWDHMLDKQPTAMLMMGDQIYPDNPIAAEYVHDVIERVGLGGTEKLLIRDRQTIVEGADRVTRQADAYSGGPRGTRFLFHRAYYRMQQALPTYARFVARVPSYAVWDDHDAFHDGRGGANLPMELRKESLRVFRENFANPYFGGGDEHPGTWCHFSLADLDFFLLDARTYRENRGPKERRFMGEEEERWLKERLKASTAKIKFLVCGSPWNNQPKTGAKLTEENYYDTTGDTLASYKWQRDQLLEWIIENRIPNVVLLSGDRHRGEVVEVWPKGKRDMVFHDLNNCNIGSRTHGPAGEVGEDGLIYVFSGRCYGLLDIDTTSDPATIAYEIWGQRNERQPVEKQYRFVLRTTDFLPERVPDGD
ncbi:MAG: alkaline phosphatase D family protein [Planctomycetaceae bacterium]